MFADLFLCINVRSNLDKCFWLFWSLWQEVPLSWMINAFFSSTYCGTRAAIFVDRHRKEIGIERNANKCNSTWQVRSYKHTNTHALWEDTEEFTWAKAIVHRRIHAQNLKQKVKPIMDKKESGCTQRTLKWHMHNTNNQMEHVLNVHSTKKKHTHTPNELNHFLWCWIRPVRFSFIFSVGSKTSFFISFVAAAGRISKCVLRWMFEICRSTQKKPQKLVTLNC